MTPNDFYAKAKQLRAELDELFNRWPELHPDYSPPPIPGTMAHQLKMLHESWENLRIAVAKELTPCFAVFMTACVEIYGVIKRLCFCYWLITHHVPFRLAHWLSEHLPLRMIPKPRIPEDDD